MSRRKYPASVKPHDQ